MSHTFLSLDMSLIPQTTKDNVPTFWQGVFSNDESRILIDGYNERRELVHTQKTLSAWLQWSSNPLETQQQILETAIEYTAEQIKKEQNNVNSIWHISQERLL